MSINHIKIQPKLSLGLSSIDKEILDYFEDDIKISNDISYNQWIIKDDNLKYLCKACSFKIIDNNIKEKIINHHDYNCEFKLIKWITESKEHKEAFAKHQKLKEKQLDRHADVIPYEFNAVPKGNHVDKEKNYINASFINGPFPNTDTNLFIATQGPLTKTIDHLWEMIAYNQSKLIIMLSNLTEEGRSKSELYWPINTSTELKLDNGYPVNTIKETTLIEGGLIERVFKVKTCNDNDTCEVKHIHVTCWPDHSIPQLDLCNGDKVLMAVIGIVDDIRKQYPSSPITIHCAAGAGRTGTFIAIYNILRCLTHSSSQLSIYNVFNVVRKLREQRYLMVSDLEQYKYIYDFISNWLKDK